jgi:phosphonate metabolism protein PhnN/1,5-bisphosphokinase (PRPP-forming)
MAQQPEERRGTLVLVVGPSGAGKDTLIAGARQALADDPRFVFARRVITRAVGAGGEDHQALSAPEFDAWRAGGAFLLHWQAHGLRYGLPVALADDLAARRTVIANVSRTVIAEARRRHPPVHVVAVTARPETLARRLAARGREDAAGVAARLARSVPDPPPVEDLVEIANDGAAADAVAGLVAFLRRLRAESGF